MAISVDFVAERWPDETFPFRNELVQAVIEEATDELRDKVPNLDAMIASGRLQSDRIDRFVRKAVIGALRNIDGYKTESEGDYSYGKFGDGFVWYRQSDIDSLLGRSQSSRVGTIRASLPCGSR